MKMRRSNEYKGEEMGKKVLILGGTGFIGINLTYYLLEKSESEITIFGRNCLGNFTDLQNNKRIKIITGIFSPNYNYEELVDGHDVVYHLISTTVPSTSNCNISKEIVDNIESTTVLLDACIKNHVNKIIFISSGGTVYGITKELKISENMSTNPITSYGLQKLAIEKLLYLYEYIYGFDYRVIRLSNPYGPFQKVDGVQGVVSNFVYNALKQNELVVFGDGSVIRDYLYIDDAINAITKIADSKSKDKIYNVGSGQGLSINDIISNIEQVFGYKVRVTYKKGRKVDVPVNILDISRYESEFGKISYVGFQEGIRRTSEFLRRNQEV